MCTQAQKIEGALECPNKSTPPSSHPRRPHTFARRGNPKMRGAKPPAIIFVWPSPTRVGAAEDEVMGVMIYWGSGTPPPPDSLLVGTYIIECSTSVFW